MEKDDNILRFFEQSQIKDTLCDTKSCKKQYKRDGYLVTETPIMDVKGLEKSSTLWVFGVKTFLIMKCRLCGGEKKFLWNSGQHFTLV